MRSWIVRALATGAAAAMLTGGAAVAATGTAFAAPAAHASVATSQHTPMARHCKVVKGHYRLVKSHGMTKKVWVKPYTVCSK